MTLVKVTPENRGNFGPYQDNLPVYSRDINPVIDETKKIIAGGEFNLVNEGSNVLSWAPGRGAYNTAPLSVIAWLIENDTYNPHMTDAGVAVCEFLRNDVLIDWSAAGNFIELYDAFSNTTFTITAGTEVPTNASIDTAFTNIATYIETIENGDSEQIWTAVKSGSAMGGNLKITITNIQGGSTGNSSTAEFFLNGEVTPTASFTFANGTDPVANTTVELKLNGGSDTYLSGSTIGPWLASLTYGKVFVSTSVSQNSPFFDRAGNWALPVTIGTLTNFRIAICILGNSIE